MFRLKEFLISKSLKFHELQLIVNFQKMYCCWKILGFTITVRTENFHFLDFRPKSDFGQPALTTLHITLP